MNKYLFCIVSNIVFHHLCLWFLMAPLKRWYSSVWPSLEAIWRGVSWALTCLHFYRRTKFNIRVHVRYFHFFEWLCFGTIPTKSAHLNQTMIPNFLILWAHSNTHLKKQKKFRKYAIGVFLILKKVFIKK